MESLPTRERLFDLQPQIQRPWLRRMWGVTDPMLRKLLSLDRLSDVYARLPKTDAQSCLSGLMSVLRVQVRQVGIAVEEIPAEGPLLIVSNHPFGMLEAFILAHEVAKVRPDLKVMANHLLASIPTSREMVIPVDPFAGADSAARNTGPLRQAMRWLGEGHTLGLFPAGEVAHLELRQRRVVESPWNEITGRLAMRAKATVLPVHFAGSNSLPFHLAGLLHPRLRTALIPRELLNKAGRTVTMHIGAPIPFSRLAGLDTPRQVTEAIRFRTEWLALAQPSRRRLGRKAGAPLAQLSAPALGAESQAAIRAEAEGLLAAGEVAGNDAYAVLVGEGRKIPAICAELGRLREVTFRAAGEGTGQETDTDRFDAEYHHLILWHRENREVVGAYRMGLVDRILPRAGRKGLYTHTLFRYHPGFFQFLHPAIELGRSFIRPEYQKDFWPLMLLWKGIGGFLAQHPDYRYLIGAVSIPGGYRPASRMLLRHFLTSRHLDSMAKLLKPRTPPRALGPWMQGHVDSLNRLESAEEVSGLIEALEGEGRGMPILIRQYLKLGGKVLGFNVDASFNQVLDALMVVDVLRIEPRTMDRYMGKAQAQAYREHHQGQALPPEPPQALSA